MPQMLWFRSSNRISIAKNTSAQVIGRISSSISTVVLTFYIARLFGSQGYGEFVKITTFVSFFYLLADFGFNAIYIQRSSFPSHQTEIQYDTQWSMLVVIRVLVSACLTALAFLILSFVPMSSIQGYSPLVHLGIVLLLPTIFFQALITTMNGLFQKLLQYEWSAISVMCGSASSLLVIGLLVRTQSPSLLLLSTAPLLIGSAVTILVSSVYVGKLRYIVQVEKKLESYLPFILSTIPLGLTLLFNVIYFHVDSIVMTFSRPTAEVGIYGLAYKVFELLLVFPTFFMNAMYPMFVQATGGTKQQKHNRLMHLIKKSIGILIFTSCILSLIFWFAAPYLIHIKRDFIHSIYALRILLLGLPFFFLSSLSMWILIALKRQWVLVYVYGTTMVVNIAFNILFVPTYGYVAASWITVLSECLVCFANGVLVKQTLNALQSET